MACVFFSGVSQISRSTPGVFLPLFSVTRRTARTLPLYEWVSRCCKACTLPHLPSFVAFAIRTWSRRTLRSMVGQSMAYHSFASFETAPTACAVVICFVPLVDLPRCLAMKHHREVCPLSRPVMLSVSQRNQYFLYYRGTFASSLISYPHRYRFTSRCTFPVAGERYGLTLFR